MSSARHKSALAKANKEIEFLQQKLKMVEAQYSLMKSVADVAAKRCEELKQRLEEEEKAK